MDGSPRPEVNDLSSCGSSLGQFDGKLICLPLFLHPLICSSHCPHALMFGAPSDPPQWHHTYGDLMSLLLWKLCVCLQVMEDEGLGGERKGRGRGSEETNKGQLWGRCGAVAGR